MGQSWRRVAATKILISVKDQQLERSRIFHETLLVLVLIYGSETMVAK